MQHQPRIARDLTLDSDCNISGTPTHDQGAIAYRVAADIGSDTVCVLRRLS